MRRILGLILALGVASAFLAYGITTEVPMGRIYGRVVMEENGKPLKNTLVMLTPVNENEDDQHRQRYAFTDDTGKFNMPNVTAGDYNIEASSKKHHLSDRTVTVLEGQSKLLDIEMSPIQRYLTLYASQQVFSPDEQPSIEVHGFIEQNKMQITVRKLSLDAMAKREGFQNTLYALARPDESQSPVAADAVSKVVSRVTNEIKSTDAEGAFVKPLPMPKLGEGFYWVKCEAGAKSSSAFLNISSIALVTKSDGKKALSYVVDIDSGKPVSGAKILATHGGKLSTQATTDSNGLATVALPAAADAHVVAAQYGESTALCNVVLRTDSEGGDSSDADDLAPAAEGRIFTYTDRPVYRPGDLVQFKSIARLLDGTEYKLPAPGEARIEVRDPQQNLLQTMTAQLSKHGTLHGEFKTSPEAKPGVYEIVIRAAGLLDHYFVNLAAYHKPDVKVTTKVEKKHYVIGDTVRITVSAEYYFGGPVVGAKITGNVYRSPVWGFDTDTETDSDSNGSGSQQNMPYGEDSQGGEYSQQIESVTDAAGRAVIEFPTRGKDDSDNLTTDYSYQANLTLREGTDRYVEANATVHVSQGEFHLSVTTDPAIAVKGETVDVKVAGKNYDDQGSPTAGQAVTLQVGEERWTDKHSVFVPLKTLSGVTDAKGEAHIPLPVDREASLRLKASAQDSGGRTIESDNYLYVEGSKAERGPDQSQFSVKLDRRKYKLGDKATALILTDDPGGVALLTVQAEHIISMKTVPLDTDSTVVHIELPKETAPNAYVSVCYVHDKSFHEDTADVIVKREDRVLSVKVTPDRSTAQPGDTVAFRVHTADSQGRGVPAEVSVGVVDESVYAIRADSTDIVSGLFPTRPNSIDTEYSFPEVYLDGGDKAGGSIAIRTHFEDTAIWKPTVETGENGDGSISLKLPDNLTTWRATVVAVTDTSEAGMGTADMRSNKPLMVRIQPPAFLVKTDHQSIPVSVTNDTGKEENVHFRLDARGVNVDATPPADIRLAIGETQAIPVEVSASVSGPVSLVARVWTDDGAKDGVESKFAVQPHGRLEVTSQSSGVQGDAQLPFRRESDADPSSGRLAIVVTPSVVAGMYQSLDGLVEYPYGCVEQTLSRFLPAVMVTDLIKDQNLHRPDLEKRVPGITRDGFARLAAMQHEDGGWGWWTYDESDAFMTAWVLDGLARLKAMGVETPSTINLKKALQWAINRVDTAPPDPIDSRLYLVEALAQYGRFKEDAHRSRVLHACLVNQSVGDSLRMWSMAALAAHAAGETGSYAEILRHIQLGLDSTEEIDSEYDDFIDERSALALLALVTLNPADPRIGRLATKLTSNRGVDGWESTRATTFAIEALTQYVRLTREGGGAVALRIDLNGSPIRTLQFNPDEFDGTQLRVEVPVSKLLVGDNQIQIHRTGAGTSYVAAELRQYRDAPKLGEVLDGSGISIDREYYELTPQTLEDGTMKLMKTKLPVSQVKTGDTVQCVLTIHSKRARRFVFIEDPIPSNCRVTQRVDPGDDQSWSWWYCDLTIFDDRVGLFATSMPAGTSTIEYTMRAEGPGVSHALPTIVGNMYDPRQKGQGSESSLEVTQ